MRARFVTATGTEIGKTFVSAALIAPAARGRTAASTSRKPVLSGFPDPSGAPSDAELLLRAQGLDPTPRANSTPSHPGASPRRSRPTWRRRARARVLDFDALVDFTREARERAAGWLMVEGIGGVAVPLDRHHTVLDWIAASRMPALLVAGSYLGTLTHTLTAAAALRAARRRAGRAGRQRIRREPGALV